MGLGANRSRLAAAVAASLLIALAVWSALALAQPPSKPGVDLAVQKTDKPDPVAVGDQLVYAITVANQGTQDATNVTVTDQLPEGADFVSASNGCDFNATTRTVTCSLGGIKAGHSQAVQITVRPRQEGQLRNTASATATEADVNPSNDRDTERTTVGPAGPRVPTCAGKPATIVDPAGAGNGEVLGTPRRDVIVGLRGNDTIRARGGNDLVCGGLGDDLLIGGRGNDQLRGGGGSDTLRGAADNDALFGGRRADRLNGGAGTDSCDGGPGRDRQVRCES